MAPFLKLGIMKIEKVNLTHPEYYSGMRFRIVFNEGDQLLTEEAFIELRNKITETLVLNGIEKALKT